MVLSDTKLPQVMCLCRWVTDLIVDTADRTADGRIVSSLEGGYHLLALAPSVIVHLEWFVQRKIINTQVHPIASFRIA
jgi:acetoin utilization deacetylase AcuC-like enzyme